MNPIAPAHTAPTTASLIQRHPLPAFFCLAFLYSWGCRVPAIFTPHWPEFISFLSLLGPAMAALSVWMLTGDRERMAQAMRALFQWRVGPQWYFAAVFIPPLLIGGTLLANRLVWPREAAAAPASDTLLPALALVLANFLYLFVLVWGEELGWRGFALPLLQERLHPLAASALLGLLWGLWHLPNFWIPGSPQRLFSIPVYLLYILGHTVIYSWIYNGARGSLLLSCIHHAATNAFVVSLAAFPAFSAVSAHPITMLLVVTALDVMVILMTQGKLLAGPYAACSSSDQR